MRNSIFRTAEKACKTHRATIKQCSKSVTLVSLVTGSCMPLFVTGSRITVTVSQVCSNWSENFTEVSGTNHNVRLESLIPDPVTAKKKKNSANSNARKSVEKMRLAKHFNSLNFRQQRVLALQFTNTN